MKELTIKQEKFCQEYIDMGNASEAYRRAYNAANMKAGSIRAIACQTLKQKKIAKRIEELKNEIKQQYDVSRERMIAVMGEIIFAKTDDKVKIADKIRAVDVVCKMMGINGNENMDNSTNNMSALLKSIL